jgi:glycosyltransferase involved in cell wall biosynthesis
MRRADGVLNVLHAPAGMSVRLGGPASGPPIWAAATRAYGIHSKFVTTDYGGAPVVEAGCPRETCRAFGKIGYSPGFRLAVRRLLRETDVCHIHGVWLDPTLAAAVEARRQGVPYIVTPHGMLDRYYFSRPLRALRNYTYLWTVQRRSLARADAIHFLTESEQSQSAYRNPRAELILPNLIPTQPPATPRCAEARLLSLSVMIPRKHIECIIRAVPLIAAGGRTVRLKIAGRGIANYEAQLRALAKAVDPSGQQIEFLGPVDDATKARLLEWASVFCLLSDQETQSLALLEALARGLPAVVTAGARLTFGEETGFGRIIAAPRPEWAAAAVADLICSETGYRQACAAALRVVDERYSPAAIGQRWADLYRRLAAGRASRRASEV